MQGNFDLFPEFAVHQCAFVLDDCTLWCSGQQGGAGEVGREKGKREGWTGMEGYGKG